MSSSSNPLCTTTKRTVELILFQLEANRKLPVDLHVLKILSKQSKSVEKCDVPERKIELIFNFIILISWGVKEKEGLLLEQVKRRGRDGKRVTVQRQTLYQNDSENLLKTDSLVPVKVTS